MDNEAPIYAKWIPDLGGYVANGTIVSKTPVYDDQGKFKVDIDTSILNQGAAQSSGLNNISFSQKLPANMRSVRWI